MNLLKAKQQLEVIHKQIIYERTGTPKQLAITLRVTPRTLRSYLKQMRALGAQVKYSRTRQTYYYTQPVVLRFEFEPIKD